jgi:hypothetical protein
MPKTHIPRRSGSGIRRVLNPLTGKPPVHRLSMLAAEQRRAFAARQAEINERIAAGSNRDDLQEVMNA